jgi:hypothetical protein
MQIPETPTSVVELDLMQRLEKYGNGAATYYEDGNDLGPSTRNACKQLYSNLLQMQQIIAPILGRTTAREMRTFTIHDEGHARKVAHLMWHILNAERQRLLTPPEIGLLMSSAYLHDLGMALDDDTRAERLHPDSDLWDKLELQENQKQLLDPLREKSADNSLTESARMLARQRLFQAEEALLCQDTRERHASLETYERILRQLHEFHLEDPSKIPDIETCLVFDGDSFRNKVVDICVSHNEEVDVLVEYDPSNPSRRRFSTDGDVHIIL